MSMLRQIFGTLGMNLTADFARPRNLLLVICGFFLASMSLVGLLSIPAGLDRMAGNTGLDDVALVLSATAHTEAASHLSPATVGIVSALPGIAHAADGHALVAPQYVANVKLRRADGSLDSVLARGINDATWALVGPAATTVSGRRFKSGINELMAGSELGKRYVGLEPGAPVKVRSAPWHVSGEFRVGDSLWNSELWTDIAALKSAFNVRGGVSSLWVKLATPGAYDTLTAAVRSDPRLNDVRVVRQSDYYAGKLRFLIHFSRLAALGIAITLGLGAILAIANALGMALAARRRETAVLRAMGFRAVAISIATLLEVLLIGALSTLAAIGVVWLLLDGMPIGTSTSSQAVIFTFSVTTSVMLWSLLYAILLGLISAFWPTLHVARAPLVAALRSA